MASRTGPFRLGRGTRSASSLIGATVLTFLSNHPADQTVTAISDLTAQHSVNPNNVIQVRFNQPMDESAVVSGVRIQPATEVSYSWNGNNLVITPGTSPERQHPLHGHDPARATSAPRPA